MLKFAPEIRKLVQDTRHHAGKGFVNPWPSYVSRSLLDVYRMLREPRENVMPTPLETALPDWERLTGKQNRLQATWVGHATYYVQCGGFGFLTDPVWNVRASPVSWAGPGRVTPAALPIDKLPRVDFVFVSHNHYDHLSLDTIHAVRMAYPRATWITTLGNGGLIMKAGVQEDSIIELDWWDQMQVDAVIPFDETIELLKEVPLQQRLEITCVPAQHNSARGIRDRYHCLWGGFTVNVPEGGKFYFAGDTGYRSVPKEVANNLEEEAKLPSCPAFKQIGELLGPFDLSMIPIGAYSPRWFMSAAHCTPEEAVDIHLEVQSKKSLAMHWGTYELSAEPWFEPPQRLAADVAKRGLPSDSFTAPEPGEVIVVNE